MKIIFLVFSLFFLSTRIIAQGVQVKWGEELSQSRFDAIIPTQNGNFIATKMEGSFLEEITSNYTVTISLIQDLKIAKTVELPKEIAGNKLRYEGITRINHQIVVFYSLKENNTCRLYRQSFSGSFVPSPIVEIFHFEQPKAFISENDIYVVEEANNKFGAVFYTSEDFKKKEMSFGYVVLNDSLSIFSKGEQRIPEDANQLSFGTYLLSPTGELFLSFNEKFSATRKKIKNNLLSNVRFGPFSLFPSETQFNLDHVDDFDAIQKIHLYKCGTNLITVLSHKLAITTINKYSMLINTEDNLMFIGSFLRVKQDKIVNRSDLSMNGLFSLQVDSQNWRITQEKYVDIPLNVYTYGLNDRKKNRVENKYAQGKLLPKLYDFKWKNAVILPNGDIVGHLEQTVRNVTYTTYNNGFGYGTGMGGYSPYSTTTANVTYYFKDIIVYCLKADGTVRWMKKIQKSQASSSYDGDYVSCYSFLTNKNYTLLFSDNAKNYADNGVFMSDKKIHSNPIFAKNNIVSTVSMDMQSGETIREQFLPKTSVEGKYVPRDFRYNPSNQTLLLLLNSGTLGNKIRCGSLEIKSLD